MASTDRNYNNVEQSRINAKVKRAEDIADEPATNEDTDRYKATKLANLLEGLKFPATKKKISNHLNARSSSMVGRIKDVVEAIENNLDDGIEYSSAYDVELATGLVKVRDESERQDSYGRHERISYASSKDVSPNTPKGQDV